MGLGTHGPSSCGHRPPAPVRTVTIRRCPAFLPAHKSRRRQCGFELSEILSPAAACVAARTEGCVPYRRICAVSVAASPEAAAHLHPDAEPPVQNVSFAMTAEEYAEGHSSKVLVHDFRGRDSSSSAHSGDSHESQERRRAASNDDAGNSLTVPKADFARAASDSAIAAKASPASCPTGPPKIQISKTLHPSKRNRSFDSPPPGADLSASLTLRPPVPTVETPDGDRIPASPTSAHDVVWHSNRGASPLLPTQPLPPRAKRATDLFDGVDAMSSLDSDVKVCGPPRTAHGGSRVFACGGGGGGQ